MPLHHRVLVIRRSRDLPHPEILLAAMIMQSHNGRQLPRAPAGLRSSASVGGPNGNCH
jgi:hypothetical protein